METEKIILHDYRYNNHWNNVEASCVGGVEGVFAICQSQYNKNCVFLCTGDDGHWWVTNEYSKGWIKDIIAALSDWK